MYDIIVIGGGPSGLTAGLYGLRNGKKVLIIEKNVFGGQITNSPKVENIPGFNEISGDEFADLFLDQVMRQGGDVLLEEVVKIENGEIIKVYLGNGEVKEGKTLIIATGNKHRTLGLNKEEDFIGTSISFCAVCDGNLYKNQDVILVGGGNSAIVEANLLADIVNKLIIIQDKKELTADQKLLDELAKHQNIEIHTSCKVNEYLIEDNKLVGLKYLKDEKEYKVYGQGIFLAIGLIPDTSLVKDLLDLDQYGYLIADETCTSKYPNIFVAGDVRTKSLRQVTTACSDGAIAAIKALEYLRGI